MTLLLNTRITAVGPEVSDLADSGVLILFADGSPPELAEVSVLHAPAAPPSAEGPQKGELIRIGQVSGTITAVGSVAWKKVLEMGHVVINFNGATEAERPGELCATPIDGDALTAALQIGETLTIGGKA